MAFGLNGTELIIVLIVGFSTMVIGATLGNLLFTKFHFALLLGFALAFGVTLIARVFITLFKRQKPEGYYQQLLHRLGRNIFGNRLLVDHTGHWDAMRRYTL